MECRIYHNPHCSKSRAALDLLRERPGVLVIDYLKAPPSVEELRTLARHLGLRPREFLRVGEPVLASLCLNLEDDEAVLRAMHAHPILIERPIVQLGERAVIGRPTENVAALLRG